MEWREHLVTRLVWGRRGWRKAAMPVAAPRADGNTVNRTEAGWLGARGSRETVMLGRWRCFCGISSSRI